MYAASDLRHDFIWAGGYAHTELLGYTGGDRTALWQAAKDAANDLIQTGYYDLHNKVPAEGDSIADKYTEIFLSYKTDEDIFVQHFTPTIEEDWDGYFPNQYMGPNGYHCWGNTTPLQELIDCYEMSDGSRFDWENPDHAAAPYENREPRFYANTLYDGGFWRVRPGDVIEVMDNDLFDKNDPDDIRTIQTGVFVKWDDENEEMVEVWGLDTRKGPIEDWNGSYTGYYNRKLIDPTLDGQYDKQDLPWRFMRYAEVLLNYAEACIELGGAENEAEAREAINMIRVRAGLPQLDGGLSGDDLMEACRHERRIELCYEEHRFWDVRRWLIADQVYQPVHGISIRYPLLPDNTTSTTAEYEVIQIEPRAWDNKAYTFPILRDEMNRNELLVQNPLY